MKATMRTLTFTVGAAAVLCLSTSVVSSAAQATDPLAPGTHVPATVFTPQNCSSIPSSYNKSVAKEVYGYAKDKKADSRVLLSTFETAWVESHVNNLNCGDADSVGVFQQRPSQGWGTKAQCMNVEHATNAYLAQAIPNAKAHPSWTAGQVAQSVQRSAYPSRYDAAKSKANEIINAVK